jgi:hypothetical protein
MIKKIGRLSDQLLRRLVPNVVAKAACPPEDFWGGYCYCSNNESYWTLCHVASNCTTRCTGCAPRYFGCEA